MLEALKQSLYESHLELPRNRLVAWTSGNISVRDPDSGLVVIKPSGVRYEEMKPSDMVVIDLHGKLIEGGLKPSADTATHLYIYRYRPDANAVIHTHSTYATAWSCTGKPVPVYLTSMADVFGQPIPCGKYCKIGGEEIGMEIVEGIGSSPAMLMKNHGVFCVERSLANAMRAAIMVEEVVRTVTIALSLGRIEPLEPEEVVRQHEYYVTEYGQAHETESN